MQPLSSSNWASHSVAGHDGNKDEILLLSTDSVFQEEKLDFFGEDSYSGSESRPLESLGPSSLDNDSLTQSILLNAPTTAGMQRPAQQVPAGSTAQEFKKKIKKFCEPNWFWIYNLRLAKYVRSFLSRTNQERVGESRKLLYDFKDNIKPGIVTAFITFPLVVAVGAGIGVLPSVGVRAAIWSLLSTLLFGGCKFTVFGPTSILTVPLARIADLYTPDVIPFVAVGSGIVVFLSLVLRIQEYIMFIPSTVTNGTSLGVAVLIFIYQFKNALGLPGFIVRQSVLEYLYHCFELLPYTNIWSVLMFGITFVSQLAAMRYKPSLPFTVIIFFVGSLTGWILKQILPEETFIAQIDTIYSRYGDLHTSLFAAPQWHSNFLSLELVGFVMEIAFIELIETYSSAKMCYDQTGLHFSQQHEVLGLSVANIVNGITGGIPVSSGISRATTNISNGATSRTSGVVHIIVLLLIGFVFVPVVDVIPMAFISAMQYISAIRLINTDALGLYWRTNKSAFSVAVASAFFCVFAAPFVGLLLGIVMSMMLVSYDLGKGSVEVTIKKRPYQSSAFTDHVDPLLSSDLPRRATTAIRVIHHMRDVFERQSPVVVYRLTGALTFVNTTAHLENFKHIGRPNTSLIINMRYLFSIDFDGLQGLKKAMKLLDEALAQPVLLCCVNHFIKDTLSKEDWFQQKVSKDLCFKTEHEAVMKIHQISPRDSEILESNAAVVQPKAEASSLSAITPDVTIASMQSPMLQRALTVTVVREEDDETRDPVMETPPTGHKVLRSTNPQISEDAARPNTFQNPSSSDIL